MSLAQIFPWSIWDCFWLSPLALAMDLLLGDPHLPWPHPVCAIGGFLQRVEPVCRAFARRASKPFSIRWREKLSGFAVLAIAGICVYTLVYGLEILPWLGGVLAVYLAWAGLAMGCLLETGKTVLERVENGEIQSAREGVAWLVSRDVSQLDRPMLRKTLADTLSENFTDALLAPFFWLVFTGPAGLWLYKTVSTMDSQWGYLTPKWKYLGYAGAKGDDLLALIPARLSPLALGLAHLAGAFWRRPWQGFWPGLRRIAEDAAGMPSPNSGWPMAACAWLCGGRMAGPSVYFGEIVEKGWIGPESAPAWNRSSLTALMSLLAWGSICGGCLVWLLALCLAAFLD